jgi:4'-phosphopantetheinyl transferase
VIDGKDVIVFLGRPEAIAGPAPHAAALAVLAPDDHAHVARHRFERDRELALASRALQRRALSACTGPSTPLTTGVAPDAWRFVAGTLGRPEIAAPAIASPLRFSVANTHGLVGCAVTLGRDVGLDLEPWRDDAPAELIERCFAPDERAALLALPAAARPRRFVELWTLKEAYLKARGIGLDPPLELISFALDDGPPRLALDPALADDAAAWQLALWAPTPSHAAAVCVRRGDGPPLTIHRRWDPA